MAIVRNETHYPSKPPSMQLLMFRRDPGRLRTYLPRLVSQGTCSAIR
jgi:hypothetical protein